MLEELLGQDIRLGDDGAAVVAANGEVVLTDGVGTALLEVRLQLLTPLGSLFYDENWGSKAPLFAMDESSQGSRMALAAEVKKRIGMVRQVEPLSARAKVASWDERQVTIEATFNLIGEDHPFNLVVVVDDDITVVIKDVY